MRVVLGAALAGVVGVRDHAAMTTKAGPAITALNLLDSVCATASVNRATHVQAQDAVRLINAALQDLGAREAADAAMKDASEPDA